MSPSTDARIVAIVATVIERNSSQAAYATKATDSVPISAALKRHPNGLLSPKIAIPAAIIHLPSGG